MTKPRTIFDHISGVTDKKVDWGSLPESDQKSFSPYAMNRWLSMNYDLIELIDTLQPYTVGTLDSQQVYCLYHDLLPKQKYYIKYVKGNKSEKYDKALIELIAVHLCVSRLEATEYIDIWVSTNATPLVDILSKYGKTDKEIKKWITL